MKEITGNIWDYYGRGIICVTTNGILNSKGELVMGKGIALDAKLKFPSLPWILGNHVKDRGNIPLCVNRWFMSFPTKYHWKDDSCMELIVNSARIAQEIINDIKVTEPNIVAYLPRPGCGNGRLNWIEVRNKISPILSDDFVVVHNGD